MAKAGFHYSPLKDNDDRALCFACTVTLVCWEPSDSPWTEHERHSPNCPFIKGDFTENVPLRTTCATQPGKKIFSHQQQEKWLIRSNELILEHILLFLNSDWIIRSVDTTNVIHIKTVKSLKSLIEQLTTESSNEENYFSEASQQTTFVKHFDRFTSQRYFNSTLIPLALTMYPLIVTNHKDDDNYTIFCFLRLSDTNKCILLITTTRDQHDTLIRSRASTITDSSQNDESVETTINEHTKSYNKYDYLIEFSNFTQIPKQAFIYQINQTTIILLINTGECIHGYAIEYDQKALTLNVLFYHCIYQSSNNDIDIDSINPIILDDEDLINIDEQSMNNDDNDDDKTLESGGDHDIDANNECQRKDQDSKKIKEKKCFLICLKAGHLLLYDIYYTEYLEKNHEQDNIGILANIQLTGKIEKCVHVRGTDTIYAWTTEYGVKKVRSHYLFNNPVQPIMFFLWIKELRIQN